ncbi:hypothetical protein glysoja_013896 [Glycine soja]|nr:hypothetical protein glysoja_013896 [Glycine soja]
MFNPSLYLNIICDRHSLLLLLEEKNAVASFLPQPFITFSSQFHFFGQSSSGFGQNNSSINPFALKPFGITTPFGSPIGFGGSSTGVAQPSSPFASNTAFGFSSSPAFSSSVPSFWSSSTPDLGSSSSSFSGFQTPRSGFGNTGTGQSGFGGKQRSDSRVASYMATTEADSCTSGSKLESISAMPIYKDKSHEQLRWEDYQLGDKGGHLSIQSTGLTGFSLYQSAANPFSTTTPNSNLFVPKSSPLSSGFGTSAAPAFSLPAFGSSTSAAEPSIFGSTPCPFGANSSSTPSFGQSLSLFNTAPAQATSSPFGRNIFGNTQSSPLFSSAAPTRLQPHRLVLLLDSLPALLGRLHLLLVNQACSIHLPGLFFGGTPGIFGQNNFGLMVLLTRNISNEACVTPPDRTSSQDKDKETSIIK